MRVYQGNGLGDFYYQVLRDITEFGRKVSVRGFECLEFPTPVCFVYEKPGYCWMNIPKRKFNPFFALAEVYWILSGRGDAEFIGYFNKQMLEYLDEGLKEFHGSYGLRIRGWTTDAGETGPIDQILHVVRKLKADPFSRQAVISLWDPIRDNLVKSKDYPCNNIVYYSLREGALDQTVVIRSNDVVWGTPVNAIQFTHLHALVAGSLGVEMGKFTYVVQNLHYYFDLYRPTLANLLEKAFDSDTNSQLKAQVIPNFTTVTDQELVQLGSNIEYIFKNCPATVFLGGGYWNQTIPQVIWLYRVLKERILTPADYEFLAERILILGTPLSDLIMDFYEDSSNECAKEVVRTCQKMLSASSTNSGR